MAAEAFSRTAAYDSEIASWFCREVNIKEPKFLTLAGSNPKALRYGENPHQSATFYKSSSNRSGVGTAEQLQGKELSYNNLNDTDAAFELVAEFDKPAVAIIKHANPCGVAVGNTLIEAYKKYKETSEYQQRTDVRVGYGRCIPQRVIEAMQNVCVAKEDFERRAV